MGCIGPGCECKQCGTERCGRAPFDHTLNEFNRVGLRIEGMCRENIRHEFLCEDSGAVLFDGFDSGAAADFDIVRIRLGFRIAQDQCAKTLGIPLVRAESDVPSHGQADNNCAGNIQMIE